MIKRHQILFSLCGPGGSGKSTLSRELVKAIPGLQLSVSTTTRKPRPGEVEGIHYHFISTEEFQKRIDAGNFMEYAEFNGNYYGTERNELERARKSGSDLLLDIDFQGAKLVKDAVHKAAVTIFIFPPSMEILEERLRARKTDSEEVIHQRLIHAEVEFGELTSPHLTDYLVINDEFQESVSTLGSIIQAERNKLTRMEAESVREELLG